MPPARVCLGIRPKELRELLTEYGISEQAQHTLTAIARSGSRGSRQRHGDALPGPYREYLALEQVPPSSGPATILRFAAVPGLGAVYLSGLSGGVCLTGRPDIASHTKAFEQLRT